MSNRYRLAAMAYPPAYRASHYPELVATADELSGGRCSARQAWSLLRHGLDTRCHLATAGSSTQVWRSGVRFGLIVTLMAGALMSAMVAAATSDLIQSVFNIIEAAVTTLAVGFLAANMRRSATATVVLASSFPSFAMILTRPSLAFPPLLTAGYAIAVTALVWWATDPAGPTYGFRTALASAGQAAALLAAVAVPVSLANPSIETAVQIGAVTLAFFLGALVIGSFFEPRLAASAAVFLVSYLAGQTVSLIVFQQDWFGRNDVTLVAVATLMAVGFWHLSRRGSSRLASL